jgi:hypothetical protein
MPQKKTTKRRTQVKDLPKEEKKLSAEDMKQVKGGNLFDTLKGTVQGIIDKYDETAKNVIQKIGN